MALVSIVVPAHNAAPHLAETLASLLRQTYRPLEILVVDDGSTDATAAIARQFGEPVRCLSQRNAGPSAARNAGIAHARGDYVAFVDADDAFTPERTAVLVAALEAASPAAAFAASDAWLWDGRRPLRRFNIARPPGGEKGLTTFLDENRPYIGILARRHLLVRLGGFRPDLWANEDCHLWLRLLGAGHTYAHVAEPLYLYRVHWQSLSRDAVRQALVACQVYEEALRTLPLTLDQRRRLLYLLWRDRARLGAARAAVARKEGRWPEWGTRLAGAAAWQAARFLLRPRLSTAKVWQRRRRLGCVTEMLPPPP
ncbi:MAG: glycosyltransferase family 2 protein [Armatimonadetes bacterium]|nr:glycosyltransferase family 2 protein [Armatimonadota bacterium]